MVGSWNGRKNRVFSIKYISNGKLELGWVKREIKV